MRNPSKTVLGFASLGLASAGACYLYAASYDYTKPMRGLDFTLVAISWILCPPQLLFAYCIDCEVIGWGGFIMYSIIGVLNTALYALIGFLVVARRKKANAPIGEQEPPTNIQGN
jgi:hypothetical protein